ncbi:MAG TPA: tetratricopeptide repeat protein, partial [Polyangia bacterium]
WKAAAAVAAAALVAGTALAGRAHWQPQDSACFGAEARLRGVWDPERQRRGRAAFVATGLDGAAAAWTQSAARLDAYTRAWAAARDEACAATRRGEQSEEMRDLRLECFDWRLEEVRAVAALLESADTMVVERAAGVTRTLTPVAECASTSALMRRPRSPRDPALRARSDAARSQVTRVRMLYYAGKLREARDVARGAAAAAHAAGQRPVEAEALLALGDILSALWETRPAEDAFWEAVAVAEASGHDEVRARALTALIWVLSNGNERTPARLDLAERCGRQASAVIERLGGDALMQARLEYTLGGLAEARGLVARARAHFERAVALRERAAPSPPDLTPALQALGGALAEEGRLAEATAVLERALAMVEQDVGPNHPRFAYCLLELARVRAAQGRGDEAVTLSKRAQALAGRVLGRESGLGIETLMVAGDSLAAAGHPAEARARYGEALASAEKTFGPADPRVARALDRVGNMLRLAGQPAAALTHQRRALAILARAVEPGHPDLARVLHDTGETLRAQGSHAEAVATLERALAGREQREVRPADVAATRFALAQALAAAGRDAARARDLAARARAGYARAEGQHAAALAVIDAWLARPGR